MKTDKKISVVAPAFNEEAVVGAFVDEVSAVLKNAAPNYEIIIIDDGSTDGTFTALKTIAAKSPQVKAIRFSRNFGHAAAIAAGLERAGGEAIVVMDSDLQDPPAVISDFLERWNGGADVVYGIRTKRKEGIAKRVSYWLFYRIFTRVSALDAVPVDAGDFCLLSRRVADIIVKLPEHNRSLRGLRAWTGFRHEGVRFERASATKYSLRKLLHLAGDTIFSFSAAPLRVATMMGFIVSGTAFLAILIVLYLRLFGAAFPATGFATTLIVILFLGGIQLITIGFLGEYIARIYDEVRKRPLYIVKETINMAEYEITK